MSDTVTRDDLIRALAMNTGAHERIRDEMTHKGVGRSVVSWWPVGSFYVWRVRFVPKGVRMDTVAARSSHSIVACGVADDYESARSLGRRAATAYAKVVS